MKTMNGTWVFGYGSLVDLERLALFLGRELPAEDVAFGRLRGFRRTWNVATDNRWNRPGYKMYLDPETGERPEVYVTFLNLRAHGDEVNGVAFRVREGELKEIRDRERNYRLTDVTGRWRPEETGRGRPGRGCPDRLLTSLGRPEAEERFRQGRRTGRAVVRADYRRRVHDAFGRRGGAWWQQFRETTDPPEIPELALERVELP